VTIIALYTSGGSTIAGTGTFTVSNGSTEKYTALALAPTSESVSVSSPVSTSGQTGQFIALATSGTTGFEVDVTNSSQTTWTSSVPTIASVTSGLVSGNGVVTGLSQGSTTITAEVKNPDGTVVSTTAGVTVTVTPSSLLSLTVIPSSISVGNLQDTGNFLAIGTYSTSPTIRDITNSVLWLSSFPNVFPVSSDSTTFNPGAPGGIVTAYGNGNATIVAEATDPISGSIQTATATFACPLVEPNLTTTPPSPGTCYPGSQAVSLLSTITIYNEGLNTTAWEVTAPSDTGTPNVIHCGPGWTGTGGSVCVATYPAANEKIVIEAQGGQFGGWSYNCTPSDASGNPLPGPTYYTAAGPNYCFVIVNTPTSTEPLNSNVTVGAIFN
jgi:hypothetical protein